MTTVTVEIEYDEACLIIVHGLTMKLLEQTGVQPMVAHSLAHQMRNLGFSAEISIQILQRAFSQVAKLDDAIELVRTATSQPKGAKES